MSRKRAIAAGAALIMVAAACGSGETADDEVRNVTLPRNPVTTPRATVPVALTNVAVMRWQTPPATGRANTSTTKCKPTPSCAPQQVDFSDRPSGDRAQDPDFIAIAFGDSFASGEGAPATDYVPRYEDVPGAQPPVRRELPFDTTNPSWPRGGTSSYDAWFGPQRCHRSPYAPFTQIMARLATAYPEVSMAFRNFACSGATSDNLILNQEMDFFRYPTDRSTYAPQATVARDWLNGRIADAVYMNMGGNDNGFSVVIKICASLIYECDDGAELSDIQAIARCIDFKLPQVFQVANLVVDGMTVTFGPDNGTLCDVEDIITQPGVPFVRPNSPRLYSVPPGLTQYRNRAGRIMDCGDDEDDYGRMQTFPDSLFDGNDMAAIRVNFGDPLLSKMSSMGRAAGWTVIDSPDWRANGMCAQVPYVNNVASALATQGKDIELLNGAIPLSAGHFHPNRAGFNAWADYMYPTFEKTLLDAVTPRGEVYPSVRPDGAVDLTVVTLDPAKRMQLPNEAAYAHGRATVTLKVEAECRQGNTTTVRSGSISFPFFGERGSTAPVLASPCGTDANLGVKVTGKICLRNSTRVCSDLVGYQTGTWVRPAVTTTTSTTVRLPTITTPTGPTLPRRK